ncbi:hypothetical protein V5O48_016359 [Marasmius crinis-equi]|uniref:Uncharacterized protein n=1 Tax=Marasmius crinis-equi TaxID=585013 RepID=A0ABR3ERZ5_9AGAR
MDQLPPLPPLSEPTIHSTPPLAAQASSPDVVMTDADSSPNTSALATVPTTNDRRLTRQTSTTFASTAPSAATASAPSSPVKEKKTKPKKKGKAATDQAAEEEGSSKVPHDIQIYKRLGAVTYSSLRPFLMEILLSDLMPPSSGESAPAYKARESDNLYRIAAKAISIDDCLTRRIAAIEADFKAEKKTMVNTTEEMHLILEERRVQSERIENALVSVTTPNIIDNPHFRKAYNAVTSLNDRVTAVEASFGSLESALGAIEDTIASLTSAIEHLNLKSTAAAHRNVNCEDDHLLPALPPLSSAPSMAPSSPTKRTATMGGLDLFPP